MNVVAAAPAPISIAIESTNFQIETPSAPISAVSSAPTPINASNDASHNGKR